MDNWNALEYRDYSHEGFEVYCDQGGLVIRSTEFQSAPLFLTWEELDDLALTAGHVPMELAMAGDLDSGDWG